MKKYSSGILLVIVSFALLPSLTFASWWNPFTWKIFSKPKNPPAATTAPTTTTVNLQQDKNRPSSSVSASSSPAKIIKKPKAKPSKQSESSTREKSGEVLQPEIYPILSLGDILGDTSQLDSQAQQRATAIYNLFISTPNLQYFTPEQQKIVFTQITKTYLQQEPQIQVQQSQPQPTYSPPPPATYQQPPPPPETSDPQIESALSDLRTKLDSIQHQPGVSSIYMERAEKYAAQQWMQQNPNALSSSQYINEFNSIVTSYGLYYMAIPQ